MNILHISATDNVGGSGRSAYRIHNALKKMGHSSRMLVSYRVTDDPDVGMIWRSQTWRVADYFSGTLADALSLQYLMYPSSFRLSKHPWFQDANVLQMYNIHGKFFSHTALPMLSRRKPIVWRLSDMWPMTGHCAYSYDCERWETGCGSCPILTDEPALHEDRTNLLWRVKKSVYERSRLHIVAPSRWIADLASRSPLLGRFHITQIPNGLDTEIFSPIPKAVAREVLGLPKEDRIILFSAIETTAKRKGGIFFTQALECLRQEAQPGTSVLVVGNHAREWAASLPFPAVVRDTTSDDRMLAVAYSASDVFVFPTLAENLPNAVLESMACGTPVVAFNVGGVPDAVRPGESGYLARYQDAQDLARGIRQVLENAQTHEELSRKCREIVQAEYTAELQAKRFEALYSDIVDRNSRN